MHHCVNEDLFQNVQPQQFLVQIPQHRRVHRHQLVNQVSHTFLYL